DVVVENCAICRNHIMDLCINCQAHQVSATATPPGARVVQACRYADGPCRIPLHCTSRWLEKRNVCSLDNREWDLQK
ncbi:hypothetical protein BD310DRAFT_794747, partial [Dichomitus squalens]